MAQEKPGPYDLFCSYSRADNTTGRVSDLVDALKNAYRRCTGEALRVFFDTEAIRPMDQWAHELFRSVRESRMLLACRTPGYFASDYCHKEFLEFRRSKWGFPGHGNPVAALVCKHEGQEPGPKPDEKTGGHVAKWRSELAVTQHQDISAWFEGAAPPDDPALTAALEALCVQIKARLALARRAESSPGNVPPPTPHFTGRVTQLEKIGRELNSGRLGVLTTLHGMGGMGKTTLAEAYAHAYAQDYGGGRWVVDCTGREHVGDVLFRLGEDIPVSFPDGVDSPEAQSKFVLKELGQRTTAAPGDSGRCLLILDNVDQAGLVSPDALKKWFRPHPWLHLLMTTRLGGEDLCQGRDGRAFIAVDELPEDEALELLCSFLGDTVNLGSEELADARKIVRLLGGYTLLVELAGAFIGVYRKVTLRKYREYLEEKGLGAMKEAEDSPRVAIEYKEKRLRVVLEPTLERLREDARGILDWAAFLPPNAVALPWLEVLAGAGEGASDRLVSPWDEALLELASLRLLRPYHEDGVEVDEAGHPHLRRMHAMLQAVVRQAIPEADRAARREAILKFAGQRIHTIKDAARWLEHRWELTPLVALAWQEAQEEHSKGGLLNDVGSLFNELALFAQAEPLFRRALALTETNYGPNHPEVATNLGNLAILLQATNRTVEAEYLFRRALAVDEASYGPDHPNMALRLNNLAELLRTIARFPEAEPLFRRALTIWEKSYGTINPNVAHVCNNLALLLHDTNRLAEAESLYRRALAIDETCYGSDHPHVARDLNNLAELFRDTNRISEAEPLFRRALEIWERSYGEKHAHVASASKNLGSLLRSTNHLPEAETLLRRSLAINENLFGSNHPNVASDLNSLADLLQSIKRLDEAEPLFRRALDIYEKYPGTGHPGIAAVLNNLAGLLRATNRLIESETCYRRALAYNETNYGPKNPLVAMNLSNLASLLQATHRLAESEPLAFRALGIMVAFRRGTGYEHPHGQKVGSDYIDILIGMGWGDKRINARLAELGIRML